MQLCSNNMKEFYVINIESEGIIELIDKAVQCVLTCQINVKERVIAICIAIISYNTTPYSYMHYYMDNMQRMYFSKFPRGTHAPRPP